MGEVEFEGFTTHKNLSTGDRRYTGLQYLAEVNNELMFKDAVRKAAQIELITWDDHSTFVRTYKGTRHTLNPEWISMNYDLSYLREIPEGYVEKDVHEKILDPLFEPILDLSWEHYFLVPIDWGLVKMHGTPYEWHRSPYPHNGPPIPSDVMLTMSVWDEETKEWIPTNGTTGVSN